MTRALIFLLLLTGCAANPDRDQQASGFFQFLGSVAQIARMIPLVAALRECNGIKLSVARRLYA